jgi:hypothetical protein
MAVRPDLTAVPQSLMAEVSAAMPTREDAAHERRIGRQIKIGDPTLLYRE